MGILTIQFGQCGNQIGHALFKFLKDDLTETKNSNINETEYKNITEKFWFSECKNSYYTPRSILVDTENKVIASLAKNKDSLKFKNIITKSETGSANNWAFGYVKKSEDLIKDVLDCARKEIEKSDDVTQIVNFLSSGGGTGSGTGSRIIESLRTEFPKKTILNVIVLPYRNGEVVTQNYNTLLTMAKLYDVTDGSIILENDSLQKICNSLLSVQNVDLEHMNTVIARNISAVLQPAINYSIYNFVSHLTSHPCYKFVQIKTVPYISKEHLKFEDVPSWSVLVSNICREFRYQSIGEVTASESPVPLIEKWRSVANLLISRGGSEPDKTIWNPFANPDLYPSWVAADSGLKHFHHPRKFAASSRLLALATNNNTISYPLDFIINQAWKLFKHKAYLHQYSKYGIGDSEFETAFEKLEFILHSYKDL